LRDEKHNVQKNESADLLLMELLTMMASCSFTGSLINEEFREP